MPTNNTSATRKKRTFKVRKPEPPKEKLYKVTLTFSFDFSYGSAEELEKDEDGDESNEEFCKRYQEYKKTDEVYGTDKKIQEHVKKNDAFEFIEYLPPGDVKSAKWLDGFRIAFVFKPESPEYESVEKIKSWLDGFSLEDGEYESGGDNGWTVKTINEKYEYGLTDYRRNPILVEEVSSNVLSGGKRKKNQTRRRR
jgi:hypothetical protein